MREPFRTLGALAAAALLAACAQTPPPVPARLAPAPAPVPATAPEKPPAPAVEPAALLNADPATVSRLLGPPDFDLRDGPGRIWRYSAPACTLLVVFYPDAPDAHGAPAAQAAHAAHVEARHPAGGPADPRACLASLAAQRL